MIELGINTVQEELLSIDDYSVEIYKKCLERIQKHFFKYVEYSHVHHLALQEAKEIGDYTASLGLKSHSIHCEGSIQKYGEKLFYEIQNKCMENAKAIGCGIAVFHLPKGELLLDENIEHVEKIALMAKNHGLKAALENGPVKIIMEIIETLDIPELGFALDTGHACRDSYDIPESIKRAGKKLVHTHLADNFGITDDHLPPGVGIIQWGDVMKELKAVGYSGVLMVELTGCSIKSKRSVKSLVNFPLETEMEIASECLGNIHNRLF
jgi:sugar phosphate isomerase/epimerase